MKIKGVIEDLKIKKLRKFIKYIYMKFALKIGSLFFLQSNSRL